MGLHRHRLLPCPLDITPTSTPGTPLIAETVSMPTNNTGKWSTKEKALFEKGYKKWGPNWKEIADIVKTRNNKQVYSHSLSAILSSTTQSTQFQ